MQIEAAEPWACENGLGQQKAVGHDDGGIGIERRARRLLLQILELGRGAHRQSRALREFVHGRFFFREAASLAPGGSRVDAGDIVGCAYQLGQRRHGEIRRPHESKA